jgi:hypothetical protein
VLGQLRSVEIQASRGDRIADWRASSQALVAVRDFGSAEDRIGSKAAVQGCSAPLRHSPQHPGKQTYRAHKKPGRLPRRRAAQTDAERFSRPHGGLIGVSACLPTTRSVVSAADWRGCKALTWSVQGAKSVSGVTTADSRQPATPGRGRQTKLG